MSETTTRIDIPRPTSGDVLERILEDHRLFEDLLRLARRTDADRAAARQALAEVLVAHATSEEEKVYPTLRKDRAITAHEEEHGEEEHAEIIEALLAFLRAKGTDTQKYDDALEELATVVNHHSNEEEQTILNPAREDVPLEEREAARRGLAGPAQRAARPGLRERGTGRRPARGGRRGGHAGSRGRAGGGRRDQGRGQGEGRGGRGGGEEELTTTACPASVRWCP